MRNSQLGASGLTVLGVILLVLGVLAILAAPEVMNSAEVNTLRGVGGGAAALGAILVAVQMSKKK
jgi:multisubunit Na+/H+ antiporter MnhG subunit